MRSEPGSPLGPKFKALITAPLCPNPISRQTETRTVRGSDYSPAIELSEQKDKLVNATGETEKYSKKQANKV